MKLVVDAVGVRPGSVAVVISNVVAGWMAEAPDDEVTVLVDGHSQLTLPDRAAVESLTGESAPLLVRLWAKSVGIRRACRRLDADALLSAVSASAFLGAGCPRAVIVHDLRHEMLPEQFAVRRRLGRRAAYGWSFRRADALICVSERTRGDLLAGRPMLRDKAHVALLGADHASTWRASGIAAQRYVISFGHFPNKNVGAVLRAWQLYTADHRDVTLRICGLSGESRAAAEQLVNVLGIANHVELSPWLSDAEFQAAFAGASAVLLPSDFEGFGLPAIEALLLGIPVVVSTDRALLEITSGHAVVAADDRPETLAAAIDQALNRTTGQSDAGVAHARSFTWNRTARQIRDGLVRAGAPG